MEDSSLFQTIVVKIPLMTAFSEIDSVILTLLKIFLNLHSSLLMLEINSSKIIIRRISHLISHLILEISWKNPSEKTKVNKNLPHPKL